MEEMQEKKKMLAKLLPFWGKISKDSRENLAMHSREVSYRKGDVIQSSREQCTGVLLIKKGRLRAYIVDTEGKEITLFRLLDYDICIFSASCIMNDIDFDVYIAAETDMEGLLIRSRAYQKVTREEIAAANYMNDLVVSRMSDVMWVLEQIVFKSFDRRLAAFLLEQTELEEADKVAITHEEIANHLGSAREVVSRMLKYFEREGLVKLSRGAVEIVDRESLAKRCAE